MVLFNKEIICTLGPASMNAWVIKRLDALGVSLFRINLSHTKLEDVADSISYIKQYTTVPVCLDTEGAQIRTGYLKNKIYLKDNAVVRVKNYPIIGDAEAFCFYPHSIVNELEIGDFISVDFNSVLAQVVKKEKDGVLIRVLTEGEIGQNKAVTVERELWMPPFTDKDKQALSIGFEMGISSVALSFANQASDIDAVRVLAKTDISVISKIETIKGVMNLEEIAKKSDALLIDRGDLSRQVPIEQIPRAQKYIINLAKSSNRKIYVATNLLESMTLAPTPTRAEVNDIFNTLNDGADGLVLAAETAIGAHPVKCAAMVSKIINQFSNAANQYSFKELQTRDYFLLPEPHGGLLVNRFHPDCNEEFIRGYKTLEVDYTVLLDAEQIALGTFSPLEGFMNKDDLEAVLRDYKLANGIIWPLPIILQVSCDEAGRFKAGESISLALKNSKDIYAVLHLDEIYSYDLDKLAETTYGTKDIGHPGVNALKERGNYFLGGKIDLIKRLPSEYKYFELTPYETRMIFENKGWSRVLGFHTRNVIHKAHEHIQLNALEKYHCDGLFLHPVVGPKKNGDYLPGVILKSYELMIDKFYPQGKAMLGAFQSYSRYSGPREAVFTALCRKNFGCSHFIVGRDHAGVGEYYKPDASVKLFGQLGDIGIVPVYFNTMHYCKKCKSYVEHCRHNNDDMEAISGSQAREMLRRNLYPPKWFMRPDIAKLIMNEIKNGNKVFV